MNAPHVGATTKLALEFLILTATRSGETHEARWEEMVFEGADCATHAARAIPKVRNKIKRGHCVPLSGRALEVLREAETLADGSGLVFPGTKPGRPLSDMTLSKLIKELGFEADVHGFRTRVRTWVQERTNFPRAVGEAALAHKVGDASEQAYARSDLFEKRRMKMENWAAYLSLRASSLLTFPMAQAQDQGMGPNLNGSLCQQRTLSLEVPGDRVGRNRPGVFAVRGPVEPPLLSRCAAVLAHPLPDRRLHSNLTGGRRAGR